MTPEYKIETDTGFGTGVAITVAVISIGFVLNYPIIVSIVLMLMGLYIYSKSREFLLKGFVVNEVDQTITTISETFTGSELRETESFKDLCFTYRRRVVNGGFVSMPQFDYKNVCVVDCPRKTLLVLEPGNEGWTETAILDFVKQLDSLGIKRVKEKYSDNEVSL